MASTCRKTWPVCSDPNRWGPLRLCPAEPGSRALRWLPAATVFAILTGPTLAPANPNRGSPVPAVAQQLAPEIARLVTGRPWVMVLPRRAGGQVQVIAVQRASLDLPGMLSIRGRKLGYFHGLRSAVAEPRLRFESRERAYAAIVHVTRFCLPEQPITELVMTARSDLADAMASGGEQTGRQPCWQGVHLRQSAEGCRGVLPGRVVRAIDAQARQAEIDAVLRPECPAGTHEAPVRLQAPANTLVGQYLGRVSKRHSVALRFRFTDEELNRRMPWAPPFVARRIGCPASPLQATFALGFIDDALARYPKARIREVLDTLYLASRLWIAHDTVGGLYGARTIAVVVTGGTRNIESTVHHEVSSLLMHRWSFPWGRWRATRAAIDEDLCGPVRRAPLKPHRRLHAERLSRNGLVHAYGCTSAENDFNTYAEAMFMKPRQVLKLAAMHRLVSRKLRLACDFYRSIGVRVEIACRP